MSASRRGRTRRAGKLAGRRPETCYVCGRRGLARQMMTRNGNRVCRRVTVCTERVLNPPPPRYTFSTPGSMHVQIVPDMSGMADAVAKAAKQLEVFGKAMAGFEPLGHMSDDGIQHHTDTP